jgi:hypothetical protein
MEAGDCSMGCGPPGFASFTDVSSHELIEAVTDPDGTGWYDDGAPANDQMNNCGEIGDICAVGGTAETGTINGFIVQNEWSDKYKKCISMDPNTVINDFTLALSSTEISVPAGGSTVVTVTLTKTTGSADNVSLTAPSPPMGLTAAFAPASATSAGGTSMLTVSAGPSLSPGATLTLTVDAAGMSGTSHMATLNVSIVAPPPDMAMSGTGGNGGSGGNGGNGGNGGGNGNHGGGGCSIAVGSIAGSWAVAALLLLALALRRRSV